MFIQNPSAKASQEPAAAELEQILMFGEAIFNNSNSNDNNDKSLFPPTRKKSRSRAEKLKRKEKLQKCTVKYVGILRYREKLICISI